MKKSLPCFAFLLCVILLPATGDAASDVKTFGAKGDGVTDDTAAIRKALSASGELHFPAGVYVLTDGIELPESVILSGEGSPTLGTFPLRDDDKRLLTNEKLAELPGTTLLFRGRGKQAVETGRGDAFKSLRYAVKTATGMPYQIRDLAVVLDVRTEDGKGKRTTPGNDRRADFDVGVLVDDSPGGTMSNVSVFGYFTKAGLCVTSRGEGSNPDYNTFWRCSFSGNYGVALIGSDEVEGPGLSGTQFFGCNLFSNDHHSRKPGDWGSGSLFIDGNTSARRADINGHYFFGGCVRTYCNVAVRLGRASNVGFHGVVFEVPSWDGKAVPNTDRTGRVVGTAETRDVNFFGCRMHGIGLNDLAATMTDGSLIVAGADADGLLYQSGHQAVRINASARGDAVVQFTRDASSSATGWSMRMDVSRDDEFVLRHDNVKKFSVTKEGTVRMNRGEQMIESLGRARAAAVEDGRMAFTGSRMKMKAEAGEVLHTIEGGREGDVVHLEFAGVPEKGLGIESGRGNVVLSSDFQFDHLHDRLSLLRKGAVWTELSRVDFPGE